MVAQPRAVCAAMGEAGAVLCDMSLAVSQRRGRLKAAGADSGCCESRGTLTDDGSHGGMKELVEERRACPRSSQPGRLASWRTSEARLGAGPLAPGPSGRLAGIFVPWAGSRLIGEGGIYYVGIATDGEYEPDDPQMFDAQLQVAEDTWTERAIRDIESLYLEVR